MFKNLLSNQKKQLIIRIPSTILSNGDLSLNEKLILSLDYSFSKKKGVNTMSNKKIAKLFSLHPNIVSYCRRSLVSKNYLNKSKKSFTLTDKHKFFAVDYKREVVLPFEVYNDVNLNTGAKLLWAEYNSLSKGYKEYFAKLTYTADRLCVSKGSITNWTKELNKYGFLKSYKLSRGENSSQRVVITCEFIDGDKILRIRHIQNPKGEWVIKRPKMLGFEEWE